MTTETVAAACHTCGATSESAELHGIRFDGSPLVVACFRLGCQVEVLEHLRSEGWGGLAASVRTGDSPS